VETFQRSFPQDPGNFCTPFCKLELFDFTDNGLPTENRRLMQAIDQINRRFPKAISVAATGFDKTWKSRTKRMSQSYTTSWNELVWVK